MQSTACPYTDAELRQVLEREKALAEATLGRPLASPYDFAFECLAYGLGEALNGEEARIDLPLANGAAIRTTKEGANSS